MSNLTRNTKFIKSIFFVESAFFIKKTYEVTCLRTKKSSPEFEDNNFFIAKYKKGILLRLENITFLLKH